MKRLFVLMLCAVVLTGCARAKRQPMPVWVPPATVKAPVIVDSKGVPIAHIPFRAGVSSFTVETMAKQQGCVGGTGAGLTTPQGPVEVYRMVCSNGQVFSAKCELRQCRQM